MSDSQNCGIHKYAKYDAMTTEELEEILRLDFNAPEGQGSDTETLLYVMGVLAERRKLTGHAENEALKAYESFKDNYMPEIETAPKTVVKKKRSPIRWLRSLSAAVAVLVIILLGTVTAKAFGVDVWEAVITWTQETFHIGRGRQTGEPGTSDRLAYSSLQDALQQRNINDALVPTWIPDRYELVDIKVEESPLKDVYYAYYQDGENILKITVQSYLDTNPEYLEQSDGFSEIYEVAGIKYYIFTNSKQIQAVWTLESFECYLSGHVTIEELKMMIDSIKKG